MITRILPKMPAQNYKSYSWRAPLDTHWRRATCEEYECADFLSGFVTTVDIGTELGQRQAHFLTHDNERSPSIQRVSETLYKFIFRPGTPCFKRGDHRVPIGRPPQLLVQGGDFRGNPRRTPAVVHNSVENWIEDFSEHQDRLARAIKRG